MDPRTAVMSQQIRDEGLDAGTELTMMLGACPVDPEFLGAFEQQVTPSDDSVLDEILGARCASL